MCHPMSPAPRPADARPVSVTCSHQVPGSVASRCSEEQRMSRLPPGGPHRGHVRSGQRFGAERTVVIYCTGPPPTPPPHPRTVVQADGRLGAPSPPAGCAGPLCLGRETCQLLSQTLGCTAPLFSAPTASPGACTAHTGITKFVGKICNVLYNREKSKTHKKILK